MVVGLGSAKELRLALARGRLDLTIIRPQLEEMLQFFPNHKTETSPRYNRASRNGLNELDLNCTLMWRTIHKGAVVLVI
jgi:hypothetical protein